MSLAPSRRFRRCAACERARLEDVGLDEVGVAVERGARRVEERLGLVAELRELAAHVVGLVELFAFRHEAVDVVRRQAARRRDAHRWMRPVPRSFASMLTTPFASILNVT